MVLKVGILIGTLLVLGAECNYFSPFNPHAHLPGDFQPHVLEPYVHSDWNYRPDWRSDDLTSAESREPLAPDYKEPNNGKKENSAPVRPSFNSEVLPGGVVDVDATDGFGNPVLPDVFGAGFGFGPARRPSDGGLFGLGGFFGPLADYKPWWKGANVCIEREESTDDEDEDVENVDNNKKNDTVEEVPNFFSTSISLSNCHQTPTKYECITKINNHGVVKTFTVRYKCCYGFTRGEGSNGCDKVLELKSLSETIEQLDGKSFVEMMNVAGMSDEVKDGNFTVFLPTNAAIEEFDDKMNEMNGVELVRRRRDAVSTSELVRNHFVSGFVDLNDLINEETINSENNNKTIRINIYPTRNFEKMVTANCVRVKKSNNLAKNGIVHVLDGVMQPASHSIPEIINENSKLTNLRQVLENTDLKDLFNDEQHYTVFAPTDEAFNKLDPATKEKLLSGKGCAAAILRHHITLHTICSSAIVGNATAHDMAGDILEMQRTEDNKMIVDDVASIERADIMATNGVIHLVDTIIIPETALYLNDALKKNNITKFQKLIEKAQFEDEMNAYENATVFAPKDEAFDTEEAKKYIEEISENPEKLKEFINYHTVEGKLETCEMENNAFLDTLAEGKKLRVNLYSTLPFFSNIINRATVNCARLTDYDEKSCGSVIHEVDKLLIPADKTIKEIIENNDKYSTLRKVMEGTEVEDLLKTQNSITFLAPDDEAFKNVDDADMKTLLEDKDKATAVLKNHILTEVLCCAGVGPQTWGINSVVPTMSGQHHQISRSGSRQVRIGRATVSKCDGMATNGVVHTITKVLFPQRPHNPHLGFFFFDF